MAKNSSSAQFSEITVGMTVKLTTISNRDTTIYRGKVVSICGYEIAKLFGDVDALHMDMRAANTNLDNTAEGYKFIIVECHDGKKRPFAEEWLPNKSVEVTDEGTVRLIAIYDVTDTKLNEILRMLRQNDIICSVAK